MPNFHCPVCFAPLRREEQALKCPAGHSYDVARQGYVHLLQPGRGGGGRHGDDRAMVLARRAFLDKGYYRPVLEAVLALALPRLGGGDAVDVGCGEGWYTAGLAAAAAARGLPLSLAGVDISREALKACAGRDRSLRLAVASAAHLPLADESCDLVLSLFSPPEWAEYRRVLKPGGTLLRALPLEEHLWSLKAAVYARPYRNEPPPACPPGYRTLAVQDVRETLRLDGGEDIRNLFCMTPYWYKTGREDQAKLAALTALETELAVRVEALEKIKIGE